MSEAQDQADIQRAEERIYENGFLDGVQKNSESRVSKFMDRKWVGLTDEEFHDLQIEHGDDIWNNFKAIEAKLKEKNV